MLALHTHVHFPFVFPLAHAHLHPYLLFCLQKKTLLCVVFTASEYNFCGGPWRHAAFTDQSKSQNRFNIHDDYLFGCSNMHSHGYKRLFALLYLSSTLLIRIFTDIHTLVCTSHSLTGVSNTVHSKRGKYTGLSQRTQQRREKEEKATALKHILKTTPSISNYFQPVPSQKAERERKCNSKFATRNNVQRRVQINLQTQKKTTNPDTITTSMRGIPKHKVGGCVKARKRKFCRRSRDLEDRKRARSRNALKTRGKKELVASLVRERLQLLQCIIRQCNRSTISVGNMHRTMLAILQTCLENEFDTLQGKTTISVAAAAKIINKTGRVVAHTNKFLSTGKILLKSNRGGKRKGRSLLDCEVFKERASLWLKTQTALYTARRLRSTRKRGSKNFETQANVPMESKKSYKVFICLSHSYMYVHERTR